MIEHSPNELRQFAALVEARGKDLLRGALTNDAEGFWKTFGRLAAPGCDRDDVSDEQLGLICQRFVAGLLDCARRRTN
jgi:hypothetical protein